MKIWPGRSYPLGATYDGAGTNFALFSEVATRVELCLFDDPGREEHVDLPETTGFHWHGYLPGVEPGQRYGYRVHGPYAPDQGHRCNPAKLLLDPYARAIEGLPRWNESLYSQPPGDPDGPPDGRDSAPWMPKSVVTSPYFDWRDDRPPRTPWHDTIVYEVHVKGFTQTHPEVPAELRGKYAGLVSAPALDHLRRLGVTAVELLPVHQFVHSQHLSEKGLRNDWGYDSIGYFAPHNEYASRGERGEQVQEFKQMVRTLHAAGIEVLLERVVDDSFYVILNAHHEPLLFTLPPAEFGARWVVALDTRLSPEQPRERREQPALAAGAQVEVGGAVGAPLATGGRRVGQPPTPVRAARWRGGKQVH